MKIWTSRYSNRDLANRPDLVKVGISVGHPRFKLGYTVAARVVMLMPTRWMVQETHSGSLKRELYEAAYSAILGKIDFGFLAVHLDTLSRDNGNRDLVLLCFEDLRKPGEWCHRRMAAVWLEEQGMGKVEELEEETGLRIPEIKSVRLAGQLSDGCQRLLSLEELP